MNHDWESQVGGHSVGFIEDLYAQYLQDAQSVDPEWRDYFEHVPSQGMRSTDLDGPQMSPPSLFRAGGSGEGQSLEMAQRQDKVDQLIRAYRVRGHRNPSGFGQGLD